MGANKISQLPTLTTPTLTGITAVVESGTTYNVQIDKIRILFEENLVINITYSELLNLINTSGLKPTFHYKITDFATTYWMLDGEGNECNGGVPIVGPVEPLIVFATSTSTIDVNAYSEINHNDIIYYEWDETNFVNDFAFYGLPEFKGVITYREDTINNNSAGWDIRVVKFRRWETYADEWMSGTTYNINDIVKHDDIIWISITANNFNKEPSLVSSTTDWVQIINETNNIHWNSNATGITFNNIFIPSGPSYYDFYSIDLTDRLSNNNNISVSPSVVMGQVETRLSNIIFFGICNNMSIKENCRIMSFGSNSTKIDVRSGVSRVICGIANRNLLIRTNCTRLMFGDFVNNVDLGSGCNNILLGKLTSDANFKIGCSSIIVGYNCRSLTVGPNSYSINIGTGCSKINIASESYNITLDSSTSSLVIGDNCYDITLSLSTNNVFENGCHDIILPMNSINNRFEFGVTGDLSLSTHVTQSYGCTIFKNSDNNIKLRYYGTSGVQIVNIND